MENRKITTGSRLLYDHFASNNSTFKAFKELINNSIQANATKIEIKIDYPAEDELSEHIMKKISIKDNGTGVSESEFNKKILKIANEEKVGGKGIGRFSALQIGERFTIETIGYDNDKSKYTKLKCIILKNSFKELIDDIEVPAKLCRCNTK